MREGEVEDNGDDRKQRGKQGEKRQRQDGTEEVSSNIYQSEGSDCSRNTNDEDVEEDEDDEKLRPIKRQKLPLKAYLRQSHSITPPLAMQLQGDDTRTSQSSSAPIESVPFVEYQEWPFQGFLKGTKIGTETIYNLEFKLPCISGCLNIPINPKALDICSSMEARAKGAIPHEAAIRSKMYPAALRPQTKRAL